jgi:diacylglycerol kinase (ATP)
VLDMQTINDKDILFIINPHSGSRKAKRVVKEIRAFASDISFVVTNNLSELDKSFKSNIEKYKVFIVVGGDGTVNEALKYLHERDDKLFGVLSAGSGNGFSREPGFKKSVKSLIQGSSETMLL